LTRTIAHPTCGAKGGATAVSFAGRAFAAALSFFEQAGNVFALLGQMLDFAADSVKTGRGRALLSTGKTFSQARQLLSSGRPCPNPPIPV
jgi:hypothetical protein